jgi:predicted RecB family nuclease
LQLIDGRPVFSATDLVGYLACEHLTALERAALAGLVKRPMRDDPELDVIRRRGFQHETRYLADLTADRKGVVEINRLDDEDRGDQIRRQADETIAAMASGAEVIFQATFFDGRWLGYADFLLRVESPERPSVWGPYHYEVADTKLARHVKAGAVLQICSYVEQLTRIQGVQPESMKVVLGGSARETATLRVDDYMAYYRAAKRRFGEAVLGTDAAPPPAPTYPPAATYPEPVEHCDVCRWAELCVQRRRDDDHLSLVAGISGRQRKALAAREIDTVVRLGSAPLPFDPPLDGASAASIERVREQARIQVQGRDLSKPIYELLLPPPGEPIEPERGLGILPEPDAGDLFLDLEGDPYALDDGVDYLFGVLDVHGEFTAIWSFDPDAPAEVTAAGEKAAFERLMDLLTHRLDRYPDMHVYHYAPYEPTALKRLMGRHATREDEVDRLLRGGVLVDLYRAVRQGLRASVESYSIKRLEPLYDFVRDVPLKDAGSSIVAFEQWLELGEGDRPASTILDDIAAYNRDDVRSTLVLRDWLETLRVELADRTGQAVPRPAEVSPDAPVATAASDARVQELAEALTSGVSDDPIERTDEQQATWLLAQLLAWHRRESKVAYWEFFHRLGLDDADLSADKGALGPLQVAGPVGDPWKPTPRSRLRQTWRYTFAPQDYDIGSRSRLYDPQLHRQHPGESWKTWLVKGGLHGIDDATSSVYLNWPPDVEPAHPEALVPLDTFNDNEQRAALLALGEWVATNGIDADGPWRAGRDLLLRRAPRCGQGPGSALRMDAESGLDAACRLVMALQESTLAIQGPPGSGKTYTGARMVVRLLAAGKKVGISAMSHKVITNFLDEVLEAADGIVDVRAAQKVSDGSARAEHEQMAHVDNNGEVQDGLASGTFNLAAGTVWLWAAEKSQEMVDVLFVDEAGQMSLANVLAMARSARSIVLLGDPQQLDQPLQGSHPPGADRSALAHLLGGHDAMPEQLGLFLEHTWRLHPAVTSFTSAAFYEGRLLSRPNLETQRLDGPEPMRGAGLRMVEADHLRADSLSTEEAHQVAGLARALVESRSTWIDRHGEEHPLRYDDVLVVAPYNAQVGAIAALLPENARVGTVDKFQGQEAPVSIYSMTSSSPEDAPRGMDFLYSRNRLNVATSRARCVAVVVAEPALLRVRARTPAQMRLANALCQFAEMAQTTQP